MMFSYMGSRDLEAEVLSQLAEVRDGSRDHLTLMTDRGLMVFRPAQLERTGIGGMTPNGKVVAIQFDDPLNIFTT